MLATIIVHKKNAGTVSGKLIGQLGEKLVLEAEALPTCVYQNAEAFTAKVSQRCLPGKLGNMMTIADIQEAKALISELGAYADKAETLNELRLMKQVADAELAMAELYEEVVVNG